MDNESLHTTHGITGQQDYFEIIFTEYAWSAFEGVMLFAPQEA